MADVVIKVGGSLLDWPDLPVRLGAFLGSLGTREVVLVAGGGAVVDVVRAMDRTHALGEQRSHSLAIRGMDVTAALLAALLPRASLIEHLEAMGIVWDRGEVPVLAVRRILEEVDARALNPLPASWEVTSDSIAARIAILLGARRLVLLKSARMPGSAGFEEAVRLGIVDPMFPCNARLIEQVHLMCLRDNEPVAIALHGQPRS
jgi:aspartokinase-like uncharacterized kinase